MANITAVKSGNWSDPTVWSSGALPTSADDVYSNGFNVTINQNVTVLSIIQSSPASTTTGGTFILTNGITVNATSGGFVSRANSSTGGFIIFNLAAPNSATLVGNFSITGGDANFTVNHIGTGTLNIVGNVFGNQFSSSSILRLGSTGTLNITGILYSAINANRTRCIFADNNGIINVTGDIVWRSNSIAAAGVVVIQSAATLNFIGTVNGGGGFGIDSTGASYIKVIGSIIAGVVVGSTSGSPAISSTNGGAINIFTGPFVSHSSGILPLYVTRMHYQRTLGSYYEFRDNSTGGALPPAASAPAIRMNSPEVGSDLPAVSNVRFGVVYGAGSLTGTMRVPAASNVRLGVAVDATVGTGAITVADIWNVLTSSLTTSGSIGERLKNVSTVQTTLQQLAAYNI